MAERRFSTIQRLWRQDVAEKVLERVRTEMGVVKPRYFRPPARQTCTEAEWYSSAMLHLICEVAFGAHATRNINGQQRVWAASAAWVENEVPLGRGADFVDLYQLVRRYTDYVNQFESPATNAG